MNRRIFSKRRIRALMPCGYCFQEWATVWDHIKPVSSGGTNNAENLYPACQRCNVLVSAMVFDSLEGKRDWIQAELKRCGEWQTSKQMQESRADGLEIEIPAEELTANQDAPIHVGGQIAKPKPVVDHSLDRANQRNAVLRRLQQGPATTWNFIVELRILCATRRIFELRQAGFEITTTEQRIAGKRVVTYRLVSSNGNSEAPNRAYERTTPIVMCAECGQGLVRKPKARPLLQGELAFCMDAHRAAFHKRKKSTDSPEISTEVVEKRAHGSL